MTTQQPAAPRTATDPEVSRPADEREDLARLAEGPRHECGVFGIFAPGEDVATLAFYGLYALQHRGQESAGISVSDGTHIVVTKEMGLVSQVFDPQRLAGLTGYLGIGHVRYSTTGASVWDNAQPAFQVTPSGKAITLGHNGNLVNSPEVAVEFGLDADKCTTDSGVLTTLLAQNAGESGSLDDAIVATCRAIEGAFSLVIQDETAIYAVRDAKGMRPLVIGRLPQGGYVFASETAALDITGAHYVRDVEPGELVAVDADGFRSRRFADAQPAFCSFEYVYLARPDHQTAETSVYGARHHMGSLLADVEPVEADLVIPVPDSGTAAAAGYATATGIPYGEALVKNRYVGRTFIQPSQSLRQLGIRLKLNPLRDMIEGRRLVVVDDSIVRGNTSKQLVRMLREAGAEEVHLRVSSPPVRHPCYYGIDMATRAELLASGLTIEEIADFVGADSLAYLPLDALVEASGRPKSSLCRACFDGQYPAGVPVEERVTGADQPHLFDVEHAASAGVRTKLPTTAGEQE